MEIEVRHLRLVQAVGAEGNLTRAGAALHLTQSALSHQLRDIESRLATPLFLRVGKRMVLTPAGSACCDRPTKCWPRSGVPRTPYGLCRRGTRACCA